jgi:transcriptional regulator NrdR family protein
MNCPHCAGSHWQVLVVREHRSIDGFRRERICLDCRKVSQTIEILVPEPYRRRLPAFVQRAFAMLKAFESAAPS